MGVVGEYIGLYDFLELSLAMEIHFRFSGLAMFSRVTRTRDIRNHC